VLARLAHSVARHRAIIIVVWVVLTLFGGFAAGKVSKRWYQSFSIPGKSAYEANQRTLEAFGSGVRPPNVVVFRTSGDATKSNAIKQAMQRAAATMPGARTSSYFSTGSLIYVSRDRHTTFEEVYPPGLAKFNTKSGADRMRSAAAAGLPAGTTVQVTGHDPLEEASTHGGGGGPSVLLEAAIGGLGALVILLFVFGTLPAVLMPIERMNGRGITINESKPTATVGPETITERPAWVIVSTRAVSTSSPSRNSSRKRKIIRSA